MPENHTRLLGRREDMDVRRQAVRFVERANTHEAHRVAGARVQNPGYDAAFWARPSSAICHCWRCLNDVDLAMKDLNPVTLDHRVERERCDLSRWHQRQWQQWTKSGAEVIR
jgi:hypothetical protein